MATTRTTNRRRTGGTNFVIQGSILAAAGIIVRLIGLLYRVPMTNIIGDEGMGHYSIAFNVYNIVLILSSYSMPLAVSKMVAARLAVGEYKNSVRVLKTALFYGTVVGGAGCLVTWFMADYFAAELFKAPLAAYALRTLAPTIWVMAYLGVMRGYFQGQGTMIPTAVSQILEQIVNAIISVVAAGYLFQLGFKATLIYDESGYAEAYGAAGGTLGTGMGAAAALLFVLFLYLMYRPALRRRVRRDKTRRRESYGSLTGIFICTVIPVILSTTIYNVNAVIDNGIVAYGMDKLGQGEEYLALWGIYNNKYLLLVHVPLAMANSLASSLIPSLSSAVAAKERREVLKKTATVIRCAMIIAIPSAVGMTVLAAPIMHLLFGESGDSEAVKMLLTGSVAVVFLSLSTVTNAILQGINHMKTPIRNALISLVLHVIALYILLMYGKMGIYSVLIANILFSVFMCMLNASSIRRYLRYRQEIRRTFLLPAAASAVMGAVAFAVYKGFMAVLDRNVIATAASIAVAMAVYGVLLIRLRAIDETELRTMPRGSSILCLARKFHLL